MIDLTQEQLISLTKATSLLPRRRGDRKAHVSTLYRWSIQGCRGVRLETVQLGGTRCTSREALQRFFSRLTEQTGLMTRNVRTDAQRFRASQRAAAELEAAGL